MKTIISSSPEPSVFVQGNIVVNKDGTCVVMVMEYQDSVSFEGVVIWSKCSLAVGSRQKLFSKENYKQFYGRITIEN